MQACRGVVSCLWLRRLGEFGEEALFSLGQVIEEAAGRFEVNDCWWE